MRTYEVWTTIGVVTVKAEEARRFDVRDKPTRLYFLSGGEVVAEFYLDQICGWVEREVNEITGLCEESY